MAKWLPDKLAVFSLDSLCNFSTQFGQPGKHISAAMQLGLTVAVKTVSACTYFKDCKDSRSLLACNLVWVGL